MSPFDLINQVLNNHDGHVVSNWHQFSTSSFDAVNAGNKGASSKWCNVCKVQGKMFPDPESTVDKLD